MQLPLTAFLAAAVVSLSVSVSASRMIAVQKFAGKVNTGSYIVQLKAGANKYSLFSEARLSVGVITHDWEIIHGFAGRFDNATLNLLRASDLVESIEEDGIVTTQATTQTDAPWGISRLSHVNPVYAALKSITALDYTYTYNETCQGAGVDVYIVDTGINLVHTDFGGRAQFGWAGSGLGTTDDHGHGSHVAGIAGGTRFGVAKQVRLFSVKVLNAAGSGTLADIISGFNFVMSNARNTGRPSIANASLGTDTATTSLDAAVAALVQSGVTAVVAAGNSNVDASSTSPARVATALTVGAVDIRDAKASFTNYGPGVDIYAPGVSITSAGATSNNATLVFSGTSQAAPHVAGLAALYLCQFGHVSPAAVASGIWSETGRITGLLPGSLNRLAVGPILV